MGIGGYAVGYHAIAHCKRCGDLVLRRKLVYDGEFPDLLVCTDCWDPQHPQNYLPDVYDPETIFRPTGDLERATANMTVVSYPPLKYITGLSYSEQDFPVATNATDRGPQTLVPPFKEMGMVSFGANGRVSVVETFSFDIDAFDTDSFDIDSFAIG